MTANEVVTVAGHMDSQQNDNRTCSHALVKVCVIIVWTMLMMMMTIKLQPRPYLD